MAGDEDGTVVLGEGVSVPPGRLELDMVFRRAIVFYGGTNSGKSVLVKELMEFINDHVSAFFVFCPTDAANGAYSSSDTIKRPFIFSDIAPPEEPTVTARGRKKERSLEDRATDFLNRIIKRQEKAGETYGRVRNLETLAAVYEKLHRLSAGWFASREEYEAARARFAGEQRVLEATRSHYARTVDSVKRRYQDDRLADELSKMAGTFDDWFTCFYQKCLLEWRDVIWQNVSLTEEEKFVITYIGFNPNIVLVFDDCAAEMKGVFKREAFRKIFYQGRHLYITAFLVCQDDTDLGPELRKGAYMSFFTQPAMLRTFVGRPGNDKALAKVLSEGAGRVFEGHRKMFNFRSDPRGQYWYSYTAKPPRSRRFGPDPLRDFCDTIAPKGVVVDETNEFSSRFAVRGGTKKGGGKARKA